MCLFSWTLDLMCERVRVIVTEYTALKSPKQSETASVAVCSSLCKRVYVFDTCFIDSILVACMPLWCVSMCITCRDQFMVKCHHHAHARHIMAAMGRSKLYLYIGEFEDNSWLGVLNYIITSIMHTHGYFTCTLYVLLH